MGEDHFTLDFSEDRRAEVKFRQAIDALTFTTGPIQAKLKEAFTYLVQLTDGPALFPAESDQRRRFDRLMKQVTSQPRQGEGTIGSSVRDMDDETGWIIHNIVSLYRQIAIQNSRASDKG